MDNIEHFAQKYNNNEITQKYNNNEITQAESSMRIMSICKLELTAIQHTTECNIKKLLLAKFNNNDFSCTHVSINESRLYNMDGYSCTQKSIQIDKLEFILELSIDDSLQFELYKINHIHNNNAYAYFNYAKSEYNDNEYNSHKVALLHDMSIDQLYLQLQLESTKTEFVNFLYTVFEQLAQIDCYV